MQSLTSKIFIQYYSYMKSLFTNFYIIISVLFLYGCGSTQNEEVINTNGTQCHEKFAKKAYNKPYVIKGEKHYPQKHYEYDQIGIASYYGGGDVFHGRKTSNGEVFDMHRLSAAHKTLPIPCIVLVTNLKNGRTIKLRINDRGPFVGNRIIDLSRKAARLLGLEEAGLGKVRVQVLVRESIILADNMARGKHRPAPIDGEVRLVQSDHKRSRKPRVVAPPNTKPPQAVWSEQQTVGLQPVVQDPAQSMDQLVSRYQSTAVTGQPNNMIVEVGTYQQMAQAQKVIAQLKAMDPQLPIQLQSSTLGQKTVHRVAVGPVKRNANLSKLLQQVLPRSAPSVR